MQQHISRMVVAAFVLFGIAASGCSSVSTTATQPSFTAPPGPPPFSIAGSWSGTFQSINLPARTITMTIVQTGSCVDGAWKDASGQWSGAISGLAGADVFSGQISFQRTGDGGGACSAVGTAQGPIGTDGIHWTVDTLSPTASCSGALPQSIVIVLQPAS